MTRAPFPVRTPSGVVVGAGCRPHTRCRCRSAGIRLGLAVVWLWTAAGCAGGGAVAAVGPLPDPEASLETLESETTLSGPTRIFFDWSLSEEGVRVSGRGIARVAPPDRARLDLFLSNGEAVAGAILIGDELSLPVALPGDILPPPELLWGTVGMVRLGSGAGLVRGEELEDGGVRLVARRADGGEVRYDVLQGRVRRIEETTDGGTVLRSLVARHDTPGRVPSEATYRDRTAFRELILTRDGLEPVEGFPDDIWHY